VAAQVVTRVRPHETLRSFLEAFKADTERTATPLRFQAAATDGGVDTSFSQMVYWVRMLCCLLYPDSTTWQLHWLQFFELER
jgi:hypothetical protein